MMRQHQEREFFVEYFVFPVFYSVKGILCAGGAGGAGCAGGAGGLGCGGACVGLGCGVACVS